MYNVICVLLVYSFYYALLPPTNNKQTYAIFKPFFLVTITFSLDGTILSVGLSATFQLQNIPGIIPDIHTKKR